MPPSSMTLAEWMELLKLGWENTKQALAEAVKAYKKQVDKSRYLQPVFQVRDHVYLLTKYLKLKLHSKKPRPKFLGPFSIVKIINPGLPQSSKGI